MVPAQQRSQICTTMSLTKHVSSETAGLCLSWTSYNYFYEYFYSQMWASSGETECLLLDMCKMHLPPVCSVGWHTLRTHIQTFGGGLRAAHHTDQGGGGTAAKEVAWAGLSSARSGMNVELYWYTVQVVPFRLCDSKSLLSWVKIIEKWMDTRLTTRLIPLIFNIIILATNGN